MKKKHRLLQTHLFQIMGHDPLPLEEIINALPAWPREEILETVLDAFAEGLICRVQHKKHRFYLALTHDGVGDLLRQPAPDYDPFEDESITVRTIAILSAIREAIGDDGDIPLADLPRVIRSEWQRLNAFELARIDLNTKLLELG